MFALLSDGCQEAKGYLCRASQSGNAISCFFPQALHIVEGGSCWAVKQWDLFPSTIPSPDGKGLGIKVSQFTIAVVHALSRIIGAWHPPEQSKAQPDRPCGWAWGHLSPPIEPCPINAISMLLWAISSRSPLLILFLTSQLKSLGSLEDVMVLPAPIFSQGQVHHVSNWSIK